MIEIPYIFVQSLVYSSIVYAMMEFDWTAAKFFWYIFFMYVTLLFFTFYGMLTVAITPNHHIAAIVSTLFFGIWNIFSGFIIPRPVSTILLLLLYMLDFLAYGIFVIRPFLIFLLVKPQRIPVWWRWYYWANPIAWTLYGLIASQFGDMEDKMESGETVKHFLRDYFDFKHDFLAAVAGVLTCFPGLFALLFAVAIKQLNFQRR